MNRIAILALLALIAGCHSDKQLEGSNGIIHISTTIDGVSRSTKSYFDVGDAISVYACEVGNINKLYIKNAINTFSGESWSSEPELKWVYDRENYDFLAVYPTRDISDFTSTPFTLNAEVAKNDLLVAVNENVPYSRASNVRLDFEHIMSKLTIKLTYRDNFVPTIQKVVLKAMNGAQINFLTKEVIAKGGTTNIELKKVDNNQHIAVVAPQSIAAEAQMISIYVEDDDKPYVFTPTSEVDLEAKKERTINLVLGPDHIIAFKATTINPWGDSDKIDGGIDKPGDGHVDSDPWGDGTEDVLTPEKENDVALDAKKTVIPSGSKLDYETRVLSMPFNGGRAEICFSGNFDKDIAIETSDARLTIQSDANAKFRNSRFIVTANQPSGGKEYAVKFKVSNALYPDTKATDLTITVASYLMPTVIMGGLEWMAFNGCGRSEDLYMLEPNMTVRDGYRLNWKKYAALSMWGDRPKPPTNVLIYPWEVISSANSTGGTIIGLGAMLWADNSTSIPCPVGWRLPTIAEMQKIWPGHGAAQNGSYTQSGVKYTSSFVHSGGDDILAADGKTKIATNLFIISDGTNELIFPVTGYRTKNTTSIGTYPGRDFYIWTKTKDAAGPPVPDFNNARVVGVMLGTIYNKTQTGPASSAFPEAYNGVRCVRNIQTNK